MHTIARVALCTYSMNGFAFPLQKHYAEGDPDTVTATATSVGLKQGKLKVYPLVHVNEEALSDGYKSATAAYASFTATDER